MTEKVDHAEDIILAALCEARTSWLLAHLWGCVGREEAENV